MYHADISYNDGSEITKQFKNMVGFSLWIRSQSGIESVLIEKTVSAPVIPDLEDEISSCLET